MEGPLSSVNLYVANFSKSWSEANLQQLCEAYGEIESAKVLIDKTTGKSRGVGFVKFKSPEAAAAAVHALNNSTQADQSYPLQVKFARDSTAEGTGMMRGHGGASARFHPFHKQMRTGAGFAAHSATGPNLGGAYKSKFDPSGMKLGAFTVTASAATSDPALGASPASTIVIGDRSNNLYFSGCPAHWTQEDVFNTFKVYGDVIHCKLLTDPNTKASKQSGFVKYSTIESAANAIAGLSNSTAPDVDGKTLIVRYATEKKPVGYSAPLPGAPTLPPSYGAAPYFPPQQQPGGYPPQPNPAAPAPAPYSYQPYGAPEQPFAPAQPQMYDPYGQALPLDMNQAAAPSYGYPQPGMPAAPAMPVHMVPPHQHAPQPALPQSVLETSDLPPNFMSIISANVQTPHTLFVVHIPNDYKATDVLRLFKDYGTLLSLRLMMDPMTGNNKGYAFINYSTEAEAQAAINGLNGHRVGNKYLKVTFKRDGPVKPGSSVPAGSMMMGSRM